MSRKSIALPLPLPKKKLNGRSLLKDDISTWIIVYHPYIRQFMKYFIKLICDFTSILYEKLLGHYLDWI
jgi:hypothetical protein